jgi:NADH:ubiquinone oxidoreductase subunit B-like Fe-S oxidoreductase
LQGLDRKRLTSSSCASCCSLSFSLVPAPLFFGSCPPIPQLHTHNARHTKTKFKKNQKNNKKTTKTSNKNTRLKERKNKDIMKTLNKGTQNKNKKKKQEKPKKEE